MLHLECRTIQSMGAMGYVTKELLGNGTTVKRNYDANNADQVL